MNWFSRRQTDGEPFWLWLFAGIGGLAILVLIGMTVWYLWQMRTGASQQEPGVDARMTAGAPAVSDAQADPARGTPDAAAGDSGEAPAAPTDAVAARTDGSPTPVPPLEAQASPPPQRTITLDDIAPGADDSPTPTPAPPTATPTMPPDAAQRLEQASHLHRLGDFVAARSRLATLIDDPDIDRSVRLEARVQLVKGYIAERYYSEALAALELLENEYETAETGAENGLNTEPPRQAELLMLRAIVMNGLGRPTDTLAAYTQLMEEYPDLAPAIEPRLAQTYLNLGDSVNAAAAYRRAADAAADLVQQVTLLESLARTHAGAGRYSEAVAAYDDILSVAENDEYRARIQYRTGETLALAGDETAAIERWRAATSEAPSSRTAHDALVRLVERQVDFDLHDRGMINLAVNSWLPAVNAFSAYLDTAPDDDPRAGAALHGLAQAYIGLGNYSTALELLARVIDEYPACSCFGEAWLDQARAHAASGDGVTARRLYRTFARDYSDNSLAPEALWRSGTLALEEGSPTEAAVDFLTLVEEFPDSNRAPQALYTVGVGAFANGLYVESADALARLQAAYPDYRWDATGYWLGRARRARGDLSNAQAAWQAVVDRVPDVYYGILSAQALRRLDMSGGAVLQPQNMAAVAGPRSRAAGDDGSRAFAEQWLADWLQVEAASLAQLPASVASDPDWQAGRLLLSVDTRGDGLAMLERVYTRYRDDSAALYAMSLAFEEMGAYRLSLISMERLLQRSPAGLMENAPSFLQEYAYPRRFDELITAEATAQGINPMLMFSLIRQESLFEEGARSVADAQGLAQIIPDTGSWVAQRLSYPNYANELIYRPYINVKFSAYYVDWVRTYLDGNLVSTLVGYNAGPANSDSWRQEFGGDDALFVARLPIAEPRAYVQAIVSNLYHYTRLYAE